MENNKKFAVIGGSNPQSKSGRRSVRSEKKVGIAFATSVLACSFRLAVSLVHLNQRLGLSSRRIVGWKIT